MDSSLAHRQKTNMQLASMLAQTNLLLPLTSDVRQHIYSNIHGVFNTKSHREHPLPLQRFFRAPPSTFTNTQATLFGHAPV